MELNRDGILYAIYVYVAYEIYVYIAYFAPCKSISNSVPQLTCFME